MFKTKLIFKGIDWVFAHSQNKVKFKEGKKIAADLIYDDSAPSCCKLDLYSREGVQGKQPLFINIHGGGYVAGDKKYRRSFSACVASQGWIVANLNYGLCPKYPFPEFLRQLSRAMIWLERNAEKYGFDLGNVVVSGDSAGAQMAAALCAIGYDEAYRRALDCASFGIKFKAAVLFCGPYEASLCLTNDIFMKLNRGLCVDVTGIEKYSPEAVRNYKYYRELDVINYVTEAFPPTFLTHTFNDIFCGGHGPRMADKLRACGVPVREVVSRDDMHDWHENMAKPSAKICMDDFGAYLAAVLRGETPVGTIAINKGKAEVLSERSAK